MKTPSLEEIASRWTLAHTIAVAAWVLVLILGLVLFARHTSDPYPATDKLKIYAGENATFTYPANWTLNNCVPGHEFIELPGTIKADYKGRQAYGLTVYGTGAYSCTKDRPERFDIYSETLTASDTPCAPATSATRGKPLKNGLYLQLEEGEGQVSALYIRQNDCFAPYNTAVLTFAFADPHAQPGDQREHGPPRIKKDAFLASRQYQDIRTLAESIRY